jgi:predicted RNA-binding Zn-ribbon protein involved in translation (DUF1610 family)
MAGWIIKCPECGWLVWRSSAADNRDNFYIPARPSIEKAIITCPHCDAQYPFIQLELLYESSLPARTLNKSSQGL